jgi:hypothetical protein
MVAMATIQGDFGGHYIQGWKYERYMVLKLGLGRKGGSRSGGKGYLRKK